MGGIQCIQMAKSRYRINNGRNTDNKEGVHKRDFCSHLTPKLKGQELVIESDGLRGLERLGQDWLGSLEGIWGQGTDILVRGTGVL